MQLDILQCTGHPYLTKNRPAQNIRIQIEMSLLRLRDLAIEYSIVIWSYNNLLKQSRFSHPSNQDCF